MKFPSFSEIFDILGRTLTRRSTHDAGKLRSTVIRKPLGWNKFDPFYPSFFLEKRVRKLRVRSKHIRRIFGTLWFGCSWSSMISRPFARTQGFQTACRRVGYMAARRNWNFSCNANFNFQLLFSIFVRTFHVHWPINRSSNVTGFGQFQISRSLALSSRWRWVESWLTLPTPFPRATLPRPSNIGRKQSHRRATSMFNSMDFRRTWPRRLTLMEFSLDLLKTQSWAAHGLSIARRYSLKRDENSDGSCRKVNNQCSDPVV